MSRRSRCPASFSFLAAAALSLSLSLSLAACGTDGTIDDGAGPQSADTAASTGDPIKACPVPVLGAIPGHETVFYECAEPYADHGNGCGPTGYLIGYGTKYAKRFYDDARPQMTKRGQKWIDDVLVCLQTTLRDRIDETTSCDDIWQTAFDSHPECYVNAGFCTLPVWDVIRVVWTIDAKDWLSTGAAQQAAQTALGCGGQYAALAHLFFSDLL